jgi:protease I
LPVKLFNRNKNSILIFLPKKDFNEEEFITVKDRFLKADKQVFITSDDHFVCSGNKGMKVKSDTNFFNISVNNFSALVLIGGRGSRNYLNNETLHKIIKNFDVAHKIVAAICSSPLILAHSGILNDKKATCFSKDKMELINAGIYYQDKNVVVDGNIVTANDYHSAQHFAETILNLAK